MFELVIRHGRLVRTNGLETVSIGISGGVVQAVVQSGETLEGREVIDASSRLVLPGLIDAHVHIPGFLLSKHLDNFGSATRAAAAGGVTTVMLMPTDDPRTATPFYFQQKVAAGNGSSYVDFCVQAVVGPMTESVTELAGQGAVSFELFLSYGGSPRFIIGGDDYELIRTVGLIRDVDGIAGITPHSPSLNARLTEIHKDDPTPTVRTVAATRPVLSEMLGISRACTVAAGLKTKAHIRAVSTRGSVDILRRFKEMASISSEVMSHHLLFNAEDSKRMGTYGVITPPLRCPDDQDAVQQALRAGDIDMVVSDHSPALRKEKEKGLEDIWKSPPGMTGLQTLCVSMLALVDKGKISLSDLVRTCCENPARKFGLFPKKGTIAPGGDADLVMIDPNTVTTVKDEDLYSRANYTTLAGETVKGRIERVLLRGQTIFHEGRFGERPTGQFVRPG
jgi:dihydroorotase